jgi:methanogenic corrinoid protein MtbC1
MTMEAKAQVLQGLTRAILECRDLETTENKARRALELGATPLDVVDAVSKGLDEVGDLYEKGEYFLMELTLAGNAAAEIMRMVRAELEVEGGSVRGKVVIGTVEGDLHYIGKDLVIAMMESRGFKVINLGVDVSAEAFLKAVQEDEPDIVAMSGLLTIVVNEMKKVVEELRRAGLRDSVKIMIGGRAVSRRLAAEIGADAYGANAVEAVRLASEWVGAD